MEVVNHSIVCFALSGEGWMHPMINKTTLAGNFISLQDESSQNHRSGRLINLISTPQEMETPSPERWSLTLPDALMYSRGRNDSSGVSLFSHVSDTAITHGLSCDAIS